MALNFNVEPYYDDFDETKNFHRVLFKPGYAVQARELTQSQTILQDQISKFGLGVFQDGSKVSGGNITVDTNTVTCKLTVDAAINIVNFPTLFAVGQTSKFIAQVMSVDSSNYYIKTKPVNIANNGAFSSGETISFYNSKVNALASLNSTVTPQFTATAVTINKISRSSTGTYLSNTLTIPTGSISIGDTVYIGSINFTARVVSIIDTTSLILDKVLTKDISNQPTTITNQISVPAMEVGIDSGVWFTNGYFVTNAADSIVPDALNAYPSSVVGFEVSETIVDSFSDASLLDPAIGASNYQAPGADRYKITLNLVAKPYVSDQNVTNLTTNKFIELVRINNGIVENLNSVPILSDVSDAIASAVSDVSGDFIVNPFSLLIGTTNDSTTYMNSLISAGKAYINGYPVQHIGQTPYLLNKARNTSYLFNQDIETYYGQYQKIKNLNGSIINFQTGSQIELHNVVFGAANTTTKVGTARIRNFSYDSGSGSSTEFKAFLTDIKIANNAIANVVSLITPNSGSYTSPTFSANTVGSLIDNTYNALIFPLPQINVSNVSSVNYVTTRLYTVPTFTNGVTTITTNGSNEIFVGGTGSIPSSIRQQNYFVVTTSSSGSYPAGQLIPMDQANVSITITNSPGTPQATLNIAGGFNGSATIYATISVTNDTPRSKVLNQNYTVQLSANTTNKLDLGVSDIYNFDGIYEIGNTSTYLGSYSNTTTYITNNAIIDTGGNVYISLVNSNTGHTPNVSPTQWGRVSNNVANYLTDNGQRDTFYDHGYITNNTRVSRGPIIAVVDYFTHSGGKGFFDVNSYPVPYSEIPSFTSPQYGSKYSLRDVIDFRPRRTDGSTGLDQFQLPAPFNNTFLNYGYYLNRIDKVVLYPNGKFQTITGIPAYTNPVAPSDISNALTVFTIYFPAYTFSKTGIQVTPTNLRKYTMKDIGVLDNRISNLEYYTSLSLLENHVTGSDVTDSTGLNLLFKNGYLVDGFTGSGVADVNNRDYQASIDPVDQLCRPIFSSDVAKYYVNTSQGSFVSSPGNKTNNQLSIKDNIVTMSYNEAPLVNQTIATEIINVNPFNVVNFLGQMTLSPASDVWPDTQSQPNINIVTDNQSAWVAAVNGTGNGTQWNDWQLNWTGQPTDTVITSSDQASITRDTSAIVNVITTQGLKSAINGGPIQVSSTTQVLSTAIIPYARSIPVHFNLNGMSPFTPLHTFMGGVCIDSYTCPDAGSTDTLNWISILNPGSGYTNGNNLPIISIVGDSSIPATATANVVGGQIASVDIITIGSGYTSAPNIFVTGANTGTAILSSNGAGYFGGRLVTDINGHASGTIGIPNDSHIRIPTGTILVEFADNIWAPSLGKAYARGTFYSQGTLTTTQTTVISTRPPITSPKPQVVAAVTQPQIAPTYYGSTTTAPTAIVLSPSGGDTPVVNAIVLENYPWAPSTTVTAPAPVQNALDLAVLANDYTNGLLNLYTGNQQATNAVLNTADLFIGNQLAQGISLQTAEVSLSTALAQAQASGTSFQQLADNYVASLAAPTGTGPDTSSTGTVTPSTDTTSTAQDTTPVAGPVSDANASAVILTNDQVNQQIYDDASSGASLGDPLSQNFFIDPKTYPNGVFTSSVDLFFAGVDPTIPVNVRIRPTVNGYPDAVNDIPGSIVWMNPENINVPASNTESVLTGSIGPATTFTFDHPIFLQPGQYSLMVAANSDQYQVYASKLGEVQYGTTNVVNTVTYSGSLFKSQNASTWIPAPSETLCFVLRVCDFAGGSQSFTATSNTSSTPIQFDLSQLISSDLSFNSLDTINYQIVSHSIAGNEFSSNIATTTAINTTGMLLGQNHQFPSRQQQYNSGDLKIITTLGNIDRWTSPIVDLQRLNTILVKNQLTPYYSANTVQESLGGFGNGGASSRYITRRVTLNNNFASTGLTVFVDVNRQPGTSIEVYYKVLNQYDPNDFDANPYVLMSPILSPGAGLPVTGANDYTSDTYQALNITYHDITTGAKYANFNIFAIKVCFYSSNPALAPQIKNFRAIATA